MEIMSKYTCKSALYYTVEYIPFFSILQKMRVCLLVLMMLLTIVFCLKTTGTPKLVFHSN